MCTGRHIRYALFLSNFNDTSILSADFRQKNTQMSNFTEGRPVGASCAMRNGHTHRQTDGRTDAQTHLTKLTVAFRNFCEKRLKKPPEKFTANVTTCICIHTNRMHLKICTHLLTNKITSKIGLP
jgi:hypothetical protein